MTGSHTPPRRNPFASRMRLIVLVILVLVVLWFTATAAAVGIHASRGIEALGQVQTLANRAAAGDLNPQDLSELTAASDQTVREFRSLKLWLSPFKQIFKAAAWLPVWGDDLAAVPYLVDIAAYGSAAGNHILSGFIPVLEHQGNNMDLARAVTALKEERGLFLMAISDLDHLQAAQGLVSSKHIELEVVKRGLGKADKLAKLLEMAAAGGLLLPNLLGADGTTTYLILGQNSDELRATGGFITMVGILTVADGSVQNLDLRDSYDFDPPPGRPYLSPPEPLQRYLALQDWRLRDANWWPDFPTSSRAAEALLENKAIKVDGVIALDQKVIQGVLQVLGPVTISGFNEKVTAETVVEVMEAYAHPPGYKAGATGEDLRKVITEERKAFLKALGETVLKELLALNPPQMAQLGQTALEFLNEKHLLVSLKTPEAAARIRKLGWDGALALPDQGDFFMVVDTNVGYNKADKSVERSIDTTVRMGSDGRAKRAEMVITYRNPKTTPTPEDCSTDAVNFFTASESCYKTYLRVYTPLGTVPLNASGLEGPMEWYTEDKATVMAGLVILPAGTQKQVQFTYVPPRGVTEQEDNLWQYTITARKQPGTQAVPLNIRIVASEGWSVGHSPLEQTKIGANEVVASAELRQDVSTSFWLRPPGG